MKNRIASAIFAALSLVGGNGYSNRLVRYNKSPGNSKLPKDIQHEIQKKATEKRLRKQQMRQRMLDK